MPSKEQEKAKRNSWERARVANLNRATDGLRETVKNRLKGIEKPTKHDVIVAATKYIQHLETVLTIHGIVIEDCVTNQEKPEEVVLNYETPTYTSYPMQMTPPIENTSESSRGKKRSNRSEQDEPLTKRYQATANITPHFDHPTEPSSTLTPPLEPFQDPFCYSTIPMQNTVEVAPNSAPSTEPSSPFIPQSTESSSSLMPSPQSSQDQFCYPAIPMQNAVEVAPNSGHPIASSSSFMPPPQPIEGQFCYPPGPMHYYPLPQYYPMYPMHEEYSQNLNIPFQ